MGTRLSKVDAREARLMSECRLPGAHWQSIVVLGEGRAHRVKLPGAQRTEEIYSKTMGGGGRGGGGGGWEGSQVLSNAGRRIGAAMDPSSQFATVLMVR